MSRSSATLLLLAATAVWGATFPIVKVALADAGPFVFMALRFGLASLVLLWGLRNSGARIPRRASVVILGVSLFVGYGFQTWGLMLTTPARSAFITALSIVLVPFLEPLVGLGRPAAHAWAGALLALAGLAVLLRPERTPLSPGDLLTLGCAASFAVHVLALQAAVRQTSASEANAFQVFAVALLAVPAATIEGWRLTWSPRLVAALLITSVIATVAAFWAMAAVQRVLSATQTAVILAFEPVAAGIVSVALGHDAPGFGLIAGGSLVVSGVLLAMVRSARTAVA